MNSKFALVIGNNEYQDSRLATLVTPGRDASQFAEVLRVPEIGGFDEVKLLINESEAFLRRAINRFFAQRKRDDLVLLYFSGHGVLDDHGLLYFATIDTEHDALSATAIPAYFVRQEMDRSYSRRQVLILDCCNSGAFKRAKGSLGVSVGTATAFEVAGYGRVVLTATDATQYAWEEEKVTGQATTSVFTRFLISGLETGAADHDGDGLITMDELHDYVYEQVVRATPKQTPQKFVDAQTGQIAIAYSRVSRYAMLPTHLRQFINSPYANVRRFAARELAKLSKDKDTTLATSAYEFLKELSADKSRLGSAEAARVLSAHKLVETEHPVTPAIEDFVITPIANRAWELPKLDQILELKEPEKHDDGLDRERSQIIESLLDRFHAPAKVAEILHGPAFTWFLVDPEFFQGSKVRVEKIIRRKDDLALALGFDHILVEVVPGRSFVGIGVPKKQVSHVSLREVMVSKGFARLHGSLRLALGVDLYGNPISADLKDLTHLLIAGTTGSGKSECVTAIIASLLLQNAPDELRFLLVDPQGLALFGFNGVPHLLAPVINDYDRLLVALQWARREVDERFTKLSRMRAHSITEYNARLAASTIDERKLPLIIVIIDGFNVILLGSSKPVENRIKEQMTELIRVARSAGVHLIITTQDLSSNILPGSVKANLATRIAFTVTSPTVSRMILDRPGAEKLVGAGDMLLLHPDSPHLIRMQGAQVSDSELNNLVDYWKNHGVPEAE